MSKFEANIILVSKPILLITPPFTQLNTPYPATAYIKGYLNTLEKKAFQSDLGLKVILRIFSKNGLSKVFESIGNQNNKKISDNSKRILKLKNDYLNTITPVIKFLQFENPTLAYNICDGDFLPQGSRFDQLDDMDWAFGTMGIQDKARHLATLYLEDLGDLIQEVLDPHFGFSRYAERLGRSAVSFDPLHENLQSAPSFTDTLLFEELELCLKESNPHLVCISVPFPGNLYAALRCGQYIKANYPDIKIVMGGGYPNTELRSLKEPRVFQYVDYITLDDGERPLFCLLEYLDGQRELSSLKRTFALVEGEVKYLNGAKQADVPFSLVGTPDYSDLPLSQYLSVIEMVNPMHRLWSDGRWNKLTMAHGCYWKKCSFCDVTLDYIKNYEPVSASIICDRIEALVEQTGQTGFHFVDEAAPPALMRELAIEILKRNLKITWWTNIRFEQRFTFDLCRLLKASGCIAVSGGLEVASDRLLHMMQKGVTVTQVAQVANHFTQSGIMVHAYLMYGFPTQTAQETIDSLEMVRQLFETGVLRSGFWHLFTMTAHSPVGLEPEKYNVSKKKEVEIRFANNDVEHVDPTGTDHEKFGFGLKKALLNYMHGACFDFSLQKWFDFPVPKPSVPPNVIQLALEEPELLGTPNSKYIWIGHSPESEIIRKSKKGNQWEVLSLTFQHITGTFSISVEPDKGKWLLELLEKLTPDQEKILSLKDIKQDYETCGFEHFELFWDNKPVNTLHKAGLLCI